MAPPAAIDIEIEGITDTEAIAIPNPLTIKAITARRLKAGKLVAGAAASTSSDFFKTPVSCYLSISENYY
jgi:aromatic amino acid aminotransferase I